jgi:hypothetical protein
MKLKFYASLFFIFIFIDNGFAQTSIKMSSWNLENFGKSKTDSSLNVIANTLRYFDVVAIQEVVAGYGGAQAIAKLVDILNTIGENWDYSISDPTSSLNKYKIERYAFIWKTSKLTKLGKAFLEQKYSKEMDIEPYIITFKSVNRVFSLATFHATTKKEKPEKELKYFKSIIYEHPNLNLIFCGDFNCPQSNSVFNPLKSMVFKPVLVRQKTSLGQKYLNDGCLASEYDNAFYDTSKSILIKSGIIDFYLNFPNLKSARKVSDHIPIYFEINIF